MTQATTMGTSKEMMVCFLMVILLPASKQCDDVSNPPSVLRSVGGLGLNQQQSDHGKRQRERTPR
jgi:hypothetical protein